MCCSCPVSGCCIFCGSPTQRWSCSCQEQPAPCKCRGGRLSHLSNAPCQVERNTNLEDDPETIVVKGKKAPSVAKWSTAHTSFNSPSKRPQTTNALSFPLLQVGNRVNSSIVESIGRSRALVSGFQSEGEPNKRERLIIAPTKKISTVTKQLLEPEWLPQISTENFHPGGLSLVRGRPPAPKVFVFHTCTPYRAESRDSGNFKLEPERRKQETKTTSKSSTWHCSSC